MSQYGGKRKSSPKIAPITFMGLALIFFGTVLGIEGLQFFGTLALIPAALFFAFLFLSTFLRTAMVRRQH